MEQLFLLTAGSPPPRHLLLRRASLLRLHIFAFIAFYLVAAAAASPSPRMEHLSFTPPFQDHDILGQRLVKNFIQDGSTRVANNFVRITPDRPSKRGSLWSRLPVGGEDEAPSTLAVVIQFRISGKGSRLFGDGLALWLAIPDREAELWGWGDDDFYYPDHPDVASDFHDDYRYWGWELGGYHAYKESFKGVGVIIDTYRNNPTAHKDVSIVANNGTQVAERDLLLASQGCDAKLRYHEGRDDFHAARSSSLARVTIEGRTVSVEIDPSISGHWSECAKLRLPDNLPVGWLREAHLGVTASTGQLADNHDVIRIDTYENLAAAEAGEAQRKANETSKVSPLSADSPVEDRLHRLETIMQFLFLKMELLEVHTEHELIAASGHAEDAAQKLRDHDAELEATVRLLDSKVKAMEQKLQMKVNSGLSAAQGAARAWRIPMAIMGFILAGAAFLMWRWYVSLRKSHLL